MVKHITDNHQLPTDDKAHLFALMEAFRRGHKAKKKLTHKKTNNIF